MSLLINGNICLRPFEEKEIIDIQSLLYESDLAIHTTPFWIPRNYHWIKSRFILENDDKDFRFKFAICLLNNYTKVPIGFIDVFNIDMRNSRAEIGIALFKLDDRKKGYGSDALSCIVRWCFENLNINRLSTKCFASNQASIKLFKKSKFDIEGTLKSFFYHNGSYEDALIFGLLRENWNDD